MSYELFEPTNCFDEVIARLERRDVNRHDVGTRSSRALRLAKKSIFSIQRRGDIAGARALLEEACAILIALQKEYGHLKVRARSGQWRVAVEEFFEALFFMRFFEGKPLTGIRDDMLRYEEEGEERWLVCDDEELVGAISDLTGEIGRQMHMWIIAENYEDAARANRAIAQAAELLNQNNSGGDLRRKVEQANRNLQRSDARLTDLKIRGLV